MVSGHKRPFKSHLAYSRSAVKVALQWTSVESILTESNFTVPNQIYRFCKQYSKEGNKWIFWVLSVISIIMQSIVTFNF